MLYLSTIWGAGEKILNGNKVCYYEGSTTALWMFCLIASVYSSVCFGTKALSAIRLGLLLKSEYWETLQSFNRVGIEKIFEPVSSKTAKLLVICTHSERNFLLAIHSRTKNIGVCIRDFKCSCHIGSKTILLKKDLRLSNTSNDD